MQGKIAVEEHFAIEETLDGAMSFKSSEAMTVMRARLLDIQDQRLRLMDQHGIAMMVLSLNAPAIQSVRNRVRAVELARIANDTLANEIAKRPDRFSGFAALPMQDPDAAVAELQRSVRQLGLKGVLVNGYSETEEAGRALYYDLARYEAFWRTLEDLDVPIYLHTRDPLPDQQKAYEGHPWLLGAAWAFGQETAVHALRLMSGGLFDRHPRLQIILGHLGEGLPYNLWRLDHRISKSPRGIPAAKRLATYFRANFHLAVSGHFSTRSLAAAVAEIGVDRIMFAIDYPFEEVGDAASWFDSLEMSADDLAKIGRLNAARLLKLGRELRS